LAPYRHDIFQLFIHVFMDYTFAFTFIADIDAVGGNIAEVSMK
jgi:hypothetical protein